MKYDIVIIGSGIAGLRAAVAAAWASGGKVSIAILSKIQAMRSHSLSAEGVCRRFCIQIRQAIH